MFQAAGIGVAASATSLLRVDGSGTFYRGIYGGVTNTDDIDIGGLIAGLQFVGNWLPALTANRTLGNLVGIQVTADVIYPDENAYDLIVTNAIGVNAGVVIEGGDLSTGKGTITNAYGVYSSVGFSGPAFNNVITNAYAFYDKGITNATNNWGFYGLTAQNLMSGKLRLGSVTAPDALVALAAGTATANTAPLKFTSGVDLTTAVAGTMEYDGTNLHFTAVGALRENIFFGARSNGTLTAGTTSTITNANAKTTSTIIIQPTSAAITLLGVYVSTKNNGTFVLTHGVAAGTETFDYFVVN